VTIQEYARLDGNLKQVHLTEGGRLLNELIDEHGGFAQTFINAHGHKSQRSPLDLPLADGTTLRQHIFETVNGGNGKNSNVSMPNEITCSAAEAVDPASSTGELKCPQVQRVRAT
jgi:hypothetical protein